MISTFIYTSLPALIGLIFTAVYFKMRWQCKLYKNQLDTAELALKESKNSEKMLREEIKNLQSNTDKLFEDSVTSLLAWHLFEDRLEQAIKEGSRYHSALAVLYVDIDNFKMISQVLGDRAGDELLNAVAGRIHSCVRQVDSVSRFAKDVFVVLLTQLAKQESAALIAQRILQSMNEVFLLDGHELYITVGIGIAVYPGDGDKGAVLLRNADHALRSAKKSGKGRYQFYQKELYANSQRDLVLYLSFNKETIFKEIISFYQPILNYQTHTVVSMEMLLHWEHPEWGIVSEDELFRFAKQQRKLSALSVWMLERACDTLLSWRKQGFAPAFISVPLSIQQLEDSHFIHQLSPLFQKWQVDPACILLEVRKNASSIASDTLEKAFNMLKYLGLKIALDRFGLDAFALCSLKSLDVDYLKLDPSLIQDIHINQKTKALVQSIVYLSAQLGMQVIAPGVSSEEEANTLKELNCLLLQGPWIAPPLTEQKAVSDGVKVSEA